MKLTRSSGLVGMWKHSMRMKWLGWFFYGLVIFGLAFMILWLAAISNTPCFYEQGGVWIKNIWC